ncbi:MAG TPA: CDP-diacylglycerol--glycerol-3-phosphate 3-phosphatidyltransferase, partial [bacterium]|nr:CDP-diacylglycerol--glycerol-3-phosphate 3-phosphatidyltransferase [bacterium]HQG46703.1 CDP-diacylglycerol--glycerol-3-phosphate 3-phosphatidyltransferase [bacterium]HQI47644.1 CDP-diacylglycerol--glycerol-3-phosphate 3-phosphatidyltransferase [bacterium]HQJ63250.1 CDP-diacylglycerol--glycerol-3-phosphate 3-phosphatidyltransferase [bacterium]
MKLPNILTVSRIFLSPVFIIAFLFHSLGSYILCFFLALIIELSDFFDGMLARRYQQISDFGKLMDPFADSISRFSIFLCFLSDGLAPLWVIAIFFYRDTLVSIIRVFAVREGFVVAARPSGKTKAWVQAVSIWVVLMIMIIHKAGWWLPLRDVAQFHTLTSIVIAISAAVTLWSGIDYWNSNKQAVYNAMNIKPTA